ncbi:MAG: Replication factor C large subunit [Candidatus Methanofastidiosum methylothiophilum]|uniref:Replication factor C large subunit n=1 Tax=Candidatus Methanofastidiosum methylothiophilum TaxID=1705564 RepID=A0A150IKY6_9EURY|nr:MAG: Replication factor C large subunit [Candidatus Methanofastidiosum methylthiophilus]KYC47951.1 MAG: Replication factor C large subunit [Candidatus Methanofastidiosum methylthiophilus]KYC50569.1 MAG: Replication factor C large subunit [Candidatus Methanofastidiosum methylthiophilus]
MLVEKYFPKNFSEIKGQQALVKDILAWINTWGNEKKALLIYGPPGSGKTTMVKVLAKELGYDLIELNASDKRDQNALNRIAGNAASSKTLFGYKKIILLDEADNIHGKEDFGGAKALLEIIKNTQNPIILTANSYWEVSQAIRDNCKLVQFKRLQSRTIFSRLKEIATSEGIEADDDVLMKIAEQSSGDMRAAINDLDSLGKKLVKGDEKVVGSRDTETSIFEALSKLYMSNSIDVRKEFFDIDKKPDELLLWIDENTPKAYKGKELLNSMNLISKSDIYLKRAFNTRNYSMWKYASDLMTGGVSVAGITDLRYIPFSPPKYFQVLGSSKKSRETNKIILDKIGKKCHCSRKVARTYLPMISALFLNPRKGALIANFFEFDMEEVKFIDEKNYRKIELAREELLKEPEKKEKIETVPIITEKKVESRKESLKKVEELSKEESKEEKQKNQQKTLFDF